MEAPFWVVWSPDQPFDGAQYKRRKHAQAVAREKAKQYQQTYFFVLKAQSCHQQQFAMEDFIFVPFGIGAPCPYHG